MKAVSIGFGLFMGIVPLWGFQMLIAIAISIFFKLNKALVILAANISIPPMIPLILYVSHATGKLWVGKNAKSISFSDDITLEFIHNHFIQYVLGAVTLAAVSGVTVGLISYILLKIFKRKQLSQ
jgi:uncharacterized protein (DUF2062 family)